MTKNYVFLKKFALWPVKWDKLEVQGEDNAKSNRRGKLTNETQVALLHTVNTLLEIADSLLIEMRLSYVLFGKFQTDGLEERFGQYRQMSGTCYHISVKQVLESERKLKTLSLIKLSSSKMNDICISDLFLSSSETKETNSYCEVVSVDLGCYESEHVLLDDLGVNITGVSVSDNDTLGLVYIGGYVAHSVLKGPNKSCSRCNEFFTLTNVDSTYVPKADNFYFNIINRGSLKYPSDYVLYNINYSI